MGVQGLGDLFGRQDEPAGGVDAGRASWLWPPCGPLHRGTFGTDRPSQGPRDFGAKVSTMFTDLDAVRSLDQATAATFWVGLVFTAALLVAVALIVRAMGWGRHEQEETTATGHPEVPQAA